eukprot:scaffold255954_cov17-Tisochrysis_lutea.AAC.1
MAGAWGALAMLILTTHVFGAVYVLAITCVIDSCVSIPPSNGSSLRGSKLMYTTLNCCNFAPPAGAQINVIGLESLH